jgi:HAD superfamily hydrolase (TIGR01549 family)
MPVRCVILDVDGTLVDSNDAHAEAWVRAFVEYGYHTEFEKIRRMIGMGGDKLMEAAVGLNIETPQGKAIDKRRSDIFMQEYLPNLRAFPQVRELVERIQNQEQRVVIASASTGDQLDKLLKIAGVDDLIEHQTSASDVEESKPAPDTVLAALEQCKCPAEQAIMVGDTPYDIESATRAGVLVVAVRSGGWEDEGLGGAIAIYDDAAHLLAEYKQSPLS